MKTISIRNERIVVTRGTESREYHPTPASRERVARFFNYYKGADTPMVCDLGAFFSFHLTVYDFERKPQS